MGASTRAGSVSEDEGAYTHREMQSDSYWQGKDQADAAMQDSEEANAFPADGFETPRGGEDSEGVSQGVGLGGAGNANANGSSHVSAPSQVPAGKRAYDEDAEETDAESLRQRRKFAELPVLARAQAEGDESRAAAGASGSRLPGSSACETPAPEDDRATGRVALPSAPGSAGSAGSAGSGRSVGSGSTSGASVGSSAAGTPRVGTPPGATFTVLPKRRGDALHPTVAVGMCVCVCVHAHVFVRGCGECVAVYWHPECACVCVCVCESE